MEKTGGANQTKARWTLLRRAVICVAAIACCSNRYVTAAESHHARHTRGYFTHEMAATIRADHPAIVPVANAIRAVTQDPLQQIVMVNDITHLLVDYDEDARVYGVEEFHATLDEMLAKRREMGWLYLRDDCDGRAVFAAHLLASLGIPFRLQASYWKEHAWVVATVNGVDYDLLDLRKNAPETNRIGFKLLGRHFVRASHQPPAFSWRRAWAQNTHSDLQTGLELGLLALDSTPGHLHQRNSMDWTTAAPGVTTPIDVRAAGIAAAGFPLGEPLQVAAIAHVAPAPHKDAGSGLAGSTSGASSASADAVKSPTRTE